VALVGSQILIGALMRHLGAGLAIPGILVIPPMMSSAVIVNFAHRAGSFLVVFVSAQIVLGIYTVLSLKQPHITSLHVVLGALTFATSLVLALTARTLAWRTQSSLVAAEVTA